MDASPLMDPRKRLSFYLLINVVVSALTTLVVLVIWSRLTAPPPLDGIINNAPSQQADSAAPSPVPGKYSGQLRISTIIGRGDVDNEHVLIEFVGDEDISLASWRLEDEDGNSYRFPALVLHSGGSVQLFSRQGEDGVTQLYWNLDESVWSEGEQASLIDPNGDEQASYTAP